MPESGVTGTTGTVGSSPTFFRFRSCDELGDKMTTRGRGLGGWEGGEVKIEPGRMLIFAGIITGRPWTPPRINEEWHNHDLTADSIPPKKVSRHHDLKGNIAWWIIPLSA